MSNDEVPEGAADGNHRINLSRGDSEVFIAALLNPRPVNERLRETVRRYRQATCAEQDPA